MTTILHIPPCWVKIGVHTEYSRDKGWSRWTPTRAITRNWPGVSVGWYWGGARLLWCKEVQHTQYPCLDHASGMGLRVMKKIADHECWGGRNWFPSSLLGTMSLVFHENSRRMSACSEDAGTEHFHTRLMTLLWVSSRKKNVHWIGYAYLATATFKYWDGGFAPLSDLTNGHGNNLLKWINNSIKRASTNSFCPNFIGYLFHIVS